MNNSYGMSKSVQIMLVDQITQREISVSYEFKNLKNHSWFLCYLCEVWKKGSIENNNSLPGRSHFACALQRACSLFQTIQITWQNDISSAYCIEQKQNSETEQNDRCLVLHFVSHVRGI